MADGRRSPNAPVAVYVEQGSKRAFASAIDWPGWCRAGRDEALALEALAAYAPRYTAVVAEAGLEPAGVSFDVVERVRGGATTDFGAPEKAAAADGAPLGAAEAERLASLVQACWKVLDGVVARAPAELRKGPRGGGRDRDKIRDHVFAAEAAYLGKLGVRAGQHADGDIAGGLARREAIVSALLAAAGAPPSPTGWLPRYAARRIAWHVMDHAWEIEDRSSPG